VPILEERRGEIEKIDRKTFVYNDKRDARNEVWLGLESILVLDLDVIHLSQLDVYYPQHPILTKNGKTPVLVFVYGGGFNSGSRQLPEPYSMGYRALGSFYAHRGFITVVPDYRLVPEVQFPAASEDVRDAVNWIFNNADAIGRGHAIPAPDVDAMFVMGHSAGAVHTKVLALYPPLRDTTQPRLKGLIWCAGPWSFGATVQGYFGSQAQQEENEPRALWNGLPDEEIGNLPDILLVRAEREPPALLISWDEMLSDIEKRRGTVPQTIISKGHNHISPNWALGSGQGEEWGEEVTKWMKARLVANSLL